MHGKYFILIFCFLLCLNVIAKKPKRRGKQSKTSSAGGLESSDLSCNGTAACNSTIAAILDIQVDEFNCNATSTACNVTGVIGEALSNSSEHAMGIDVDKLAMNLSSIRKLLANDTTLDYLLVPNPDDDKMSMPGSYILAVLQKANYDNLTAPTLFSDIPVDVNFAVYINSLSDIDTTRMEYTVDINLIMQWRDVRLIHTFAPYILIKEKSIIERLWRADPYFINEKDATLVDVTYPNMKMSVFPEGEVIYEMRLILTLACPMVFCRYPHDTQQCDIRIGSIAYSDDSVIFDWVNNSAVEFNKENRLPEYFLTKLDASTCINAGKLVSSSCLRVVFNLKRSIENHLLRKYIPSVFAMIFSWSALYAPHKLEEVKIVNPVVVLLTLKQLQRADESLPPVSYVTPLDIWFTVVQGFTILALVEGVLFYSFIKRKNAYKKRAKQPNLDEEEITDLLEKGRKYKVRAESMESKAKYLFPIFFIIFVILYACLAVTGDQNYCLSKSTLSAISATVGET